MTSTAKDWNDVLVSGALKHVIIKPRWWMYWSPKAHRDARNATTVLRYTGEQKQNKALKKILKKA